MKNGLFLFCLLVLSACAEHKVPTVPEGRCVTNEDCKAGLRCNPEQYCVDIYHPEVSTGRPKVGR